MAAAHEHWVQAVSAPQTPRPSVATARTARKRGRPRSLLGAHALLLLGLATTALAATGAWWWSGQEGSLQRVVQWASALQGKGSTWQAQQVQGSLRHGGRMGQVQWQTPTHSATATDVVLGWDAAALLRGHVPLHTLHIGQLQGHSTPSATRKPAPTDLVWPLTLDVDVRLERLRWRHTVPIEADQVRGRYQFDGQHHRLHVAQLQWAKGQYRADVTLQGAAPMAVQADVHGDLVTCCTQPPASRSGPAAASNGKAVAPAAPVGSANWPTPQTLQAHVSAQGQLSGPTAQLAVQAQLTPLRASAHSPQLRLQAQVQPFASPALDALQGDWQGIDAALLWPQAPRTRLDGSVQAQRSGPDWQMNLRLRNHAHGTWDAGQLPLQQLNAQLRRTASGWSVPQLDAQWPGGGVQGSGQWQTGKQTGDWQVTRLQPAQWWSHASGPALSGRIRAARTSAGGVEVQAQLQPHVQPDGPSPTHPSGDTPGLQAQLTWDGQMLQLHQLQANWAQAQVQATGQWHPQNQTLDGQAQAQAPGLSAHWQGHLSPHSGQGQWRAKATDTAQTRAWWQRGWAAPTPATRPLAPPAWMQALPTTWQAQGEWQGGWQGTPGLNWQAQLHTPSSQAQARGQLAHTAGAAPWQGQIDHLQWRGPAPQWRGLPAWGTGSMASTYSPPNGPAATATATATATAAPTPAAGKREAAEHITASLQSPLAWQWGAAQALQWQAHHWHLSATGGVAKLAVGDGRWQAATPSRTQPHTGVLRADVSDLPLRWSHWLGLPPLQGDALLRGHIDVALQAQPHLAVWLERSAGDIWAAPVTEATTTATPVAAAPALSSSSAASARADTAPARRNAAGLRAARISLHTDGEKAHLNLLWDSAHAGHMQAQLATRLDWTALNNPAESTSASTAALWPEQAPLSGHITAQLPQISAWSWLAPPGWRVQGTLNAQVDMGGTRATPLWTGSVHADQLAARSAVDGIEFQQGQLRARLQDQRVLLERFHLSGAGAQGGDITAQGEVRWQPPTRTDTAPAPVAHGVLMQLTLQANQLRVSNRADRRLTLSGQVQAQLKQGQMQLRGQLQADSAHFILSDASAPTLGKDVQLVSAEPARSASASTPPSASPPATLPATAQAGRAKTPAPNATASVMGHPDVQVMLDLGPDFQLQGQGINTRLAGQVQLTSSAQTQGQPRLHGQVRTEGGRYRAYGQQLTIEQGLLQFAGPYDNPALDILALRPNISQRVGARITGNANAPRVRLYAEPDMPEADKLAWLVLGRTPAAGGSESAVLQQAALALLSGNGKGLGTDLAQAIGFDDVSLAQRSNTSATGETTTGAALLLGKRLSKDFYLAYESSVNGAFGHLFIFYELSRKLTLRAQTGEQSALDLIYTVRRD